MRFGIAILLFVVSGVAVSQARPPKALQGFAVSPLMVELNTEKNGGEVDFSIRATVDSPSDLLIAYKLPTQGEDGGVTFAPVEEKDELARFLYLGERGTYRRALSTKLHVDRTGWQEIHGRIRVSPSMIRRTTMLALGVRRLPKSSAEGSGGVSAGGTLSPEFVVQIVLNHSARFVRQSHVLELRDGLTAAGGGLLLEASLKNESDVMLAVDGEAIVRNKKNRVVGKTRLLTEARFRKGKVESKDSVRVYPKTRIGLVADLLGVIQEPGSYKVVVRGKTSSRRSLSGKPIEVTVTAKELAPQSLTVKQPERHLQLPKGTLARGGLVEFNFSNPNRSEPVTLVPKAASSADGTLTVGFDSGAVTVAPRSSLAVTGRVTVRAIPQVEATVNVPFSIRAENRWGGMVDTVVAKVIFHPMPEFPAGSGSPGPFSGVSVGSGPSSEHPPSAGQSAAAGAAAGARDSSGDSKPKSKSD